MYVAVMVCVLFHLVTLIIDVLISMKRVGICGTDIGVWSSGGELLGNTLENVILGHECAGVIAKVGSDVKHLKEVKYQTAFSFCI